MDLAGEKKRLRERVGALRDAMTAREHADASGAICERLWRLCCGGMARSTAADESERSWTVVPPHDFALAAYMPHRSEADIAPLIERFWHAGMKVALPKAEPRERQLRFFCVRSAADLAVGTYGIREPLPTLPEATADELAALDVLLIPGLAFDESLRRLGYGGGYYDRLLARLAALVPSAGTASAAATVESTCAGMPRESGWSTQQVDESAPSATAASAASTAEPGGVAPSAAALKAGAPCTATSADRRIAMQASATPAPALRRPLLIAAAFELQLVEAVPTEPHDIPLDAIVTERRVILPI